ncbi:MAG: putative bifunctional diguanylate cyclase/phosphodiesterase [Jatrophihabitantaceae bacterium]
MDSPRAEARMDRALLDGVLGVVRELGASSRLREALDVIADAVVGVLGFEAAAINVATGDGDLRIEAVVGPPGVEALLGNRRPVDHWLELLSSAEPWGGLRFFSHERDQSLVDKFATWTPPGVAQPDPEAWHPEDSLLAPLWDDGRLIGVLSVDQPRSGRRPDAGQCTVLEVFAMQAAKAIREAQERQLADARRREVEHRWELVFACSPIGVALLDTSGGFTQVNDALVRLLGYPRDQLLGMTLADISHPEDRTDNLELFHEFVAGKRDRNALERRYLRADGALLCGMLHLGAIRDADGAVQTVVVQVSDLTERKRAEERLAYRLTHVALTGLCNRAELTRLLSGYLASGQQVGVLFCDVDRFKTINDSLGRQAGDQVLLAVAGRLAAALDDRCVLGDLDGDEFVVLAPGNGDTCALRRLGEQLIAAAASPLQAGDVLLSVGMSVGVTISSPLHRHADEMLREAEQATARAKQHGRGRVEFYDARHDHSFTVEDLTMEQALRHAADTGEGLRLYLQPIVNVDDESVVGAEALIRWQHPQRGLLEPGDFMNTAMLGGLIDPLGWRVLELALQEIPQWGSGFPAPRWLAVNVAAEQLGRGLLGPAVRNALDRNGIAARRLHLEITESALVDASPQAIREVREVAALGVSIALDDFGTGYSSLSLLRDLPISVVKIDRSFIAPIAEDRRTAALVRSVVVMCNALAISTVAEGVETREQLALVSALGCDHAQGYLFGRPAPPPGPRPRPTPTG